MIEVVPIEKPKKRKSKLPMPKFLRKYKPKQNFDSIFKRELERLEKYGQD